MNSRQIVSVFCAVTAAVTVLAPPMKAETAVDGRSNLAFCCAADNDLYRIMTASGAEYPRYESAEQAIAAAPAGSGVLILADGYPRKTTAIDRAVFDASAKKKLRLYVEYPASLPEMDVGPARRARLERAVVASDVFGEPLEKMRLLVIHDCHFVELQAADPYLVLAKVAGYDTAVFGLEGGAVHPILFEHPNGRVLVSTTKLSQFVTARYAPKEAWQTIWRTILDWLQPGQEIPALDWVPTVRPTYSRNAELPPDAVRQAIIRGIDWHTNAKMLIGESWKDKYEEYRRTGIVDPRNPIGPAPDPAWPAGDGQYAVLEGVNSTIYYDGTQPVRWWRRTDSIGESSLAFALRSKIDGDRRSEKIATNLLDWVYFNSGLFQKDPGKANFGLCHWAHDSSSLYGDNDIKIILGCLGTAAVLDTDRWDEALLQNIVGNFRTTGRLGFRGGRLEDRSLLEHGWQERWRARTIHYAPHYEAWIWASYLWAYDKTGDPILLERTRNAIGMMMAAYPDGWRWTNGIQQERGRMLLPLAWLIRVEDKPQYRAWLKRLATDMQKCQDASGAIREELGDLDKGGYRPPRSNAEYGTREASAIQQNGDPMADMLYTCNFTFLGLHEAYAATGDPQYREMADKLAEFFVRIQVQSQAHPELDGGWFRTFDYQKWDYWGSNADAGWGAWSIEVGWTQAWIPTVLALRELDRNLWDMTKGSQIGKHWEKTRRLMLPDDEIKLPESEKVSHAAVGKPVSLARPPDPLYPGFGAAGLTDGLLGAANHVGYEWLGFLGNDLEATIDLGAPTDVRELGANFLRSTQVGVFLPKRVEFALSEDGREFRTVATVDPKTPRHKPGPLTVTVNAGDLKVQARYVRVRAQNVGTIPAGHRSAGVKAWLFVDEVLINPMPAEPRDKDRP